MKAVQCGIQQGHAVPPGCACVQQYTVGSFLTCALIQTLFDAACEEGTDRVLLNARASRRYSVPLLNAALNRFHAGSAPSPQAAPLELREEILRLREENLKLRERIFELEQMLNIPSGGASIPCTSTLNPEPVVK